MVGKWVANHRGNPDADGRVYDGYAASQYKDSSPLFRFGYGLSYTTFTYSALRVSASPGGGALWCVLFIVYNIGARDGAEVVQVYVQDPAGLPFVPYWKRLVGFGRVHVVVGALSPLVVDVPRDNVAQYAGSPPVLTLFCGQYNLLVGGDSETALLAATVIV